MANVVKFFVLKTLPVSQVELEKLAILAYQSVTAVYPEPKEILIRSRLHASTTVMGEKVADKAHITLSYKDRDDKPDSTTKLYSTDPVWPATSKEMYDLAYDHSYLLRNSKTLPEKPPTSFESSLVVPGPQSYSQPGYNQTATNEVSFYQSYDPPAPAQSGSTSEATSISPDILINVNVARLSHRGRDDTYDFPNEEGRTVETKKKDWQEASLLIDGMVRTGLVYTGKRSGKKYYTLEVLPRK